MRLRAALRPSLVGLLLALALPGAVGAQGVLQFDPLHGELSLGYDGRINRM